MTELSWFEDYGVNHYKGYDLSHLKMDEAYLTINLPLSSNFFYLYRRHRECLKVSTKFVFSREFTLERYNIYCSFQFLNIF